MNKDLWSGVLFAGLGALVAFVLIPVGVDEPRRIKYAALAPSYYPGLVAFAMIVLGATVAGRSLLTPRPEARPTEMRPDATRRTTLIFGLLLAYSLTVSSLGFVLASTCALGGALWLAGERRPTVMLPIALILPLLLYFFFLKVAKVPIPLGVLAPLLQGI
ncbi:MAG: tripartite tricarboxylate transporter TctB family protein [Pseudomonadota bacterium]